MTTPHDIRLEIEELREQGEVPPEISKWIDYLEQRLPKLPKNGMICPNCERKTYSACTTCQHCHFRLKAKRRRLEVLPIRMPEPEPLDNNTCHGCLQTFAASDEKHTLIDCGCTYHIHCLNRITKRKFERQRSCCGFPIPLQFYDD